MTTRTEAEAARIYGYATFAEARRSAERDMRNSRHSSEISTCRRYIREITKAEAAWKAEA